MATLPDIKEKTQYVFLCMCISVHVWGTVEGWLGELTASGIPWGSWNGGKTVLWTSCTGHCARAVSSWSRVLDLEIGTTLWRSESRLRAESTLWFPPTVGEPNAWNQDDCSTFSFVIAEFISQLSHLVFWVWHPVVNCFNLVCFQVAKGNQKGFMQVWDQFTDESRATRSRCYGHSDLEGAWYYPTSHSGQGIEELDMVFIYMIWHIICSPGLVWAFTTPRFCSPSYAENIVEIILMGRLKPWTLCTPCVGKAFLK